MYAIPGGSFLLLSLRASSRTGISECLPEGSERVEKQERFTLTLIYIFSYLRRDGEMLGMPLCIVPCGYKEVKDFPLFSGNSEKL